MVENAAYIRTSAMRRHSIEDATDEIYPIPGYSDDSIVGAGIPSGQFWFQRIGWCYRPWASPSYPSDSDQQEREQQTDEDQGLDEPDDESYEEVKLDGTNEEDLDDPDKSYMKSATPENTDPILGGEWANSLGSPLKPSAARRVPLALAATCGTGARVRATMAYATCPISTSPFNQGTDTRPSVDYDLALCSDTKQKCYGVSQSFDDTREGFDVRVPAGVTDSVLYLIKPAEPPGGTTACTTFGGSSEPIAFSVLRWDSPCP